MRGRGLKLLLMNSIISNKDVAPYAGAWIETLHVSMYGKLNKRSPPMRGRGLKLAEEYYAALESQSPPMRGRGLKLKPGKLLDRVAVVAPNAGGWIETPAGRNNCQRAARRPLCGGVD